MLYKNIVWPRSNRHHPIHTHKKVARVVAFFAALILYCIFTHYMLRKDAGIADVNATLTQVIEGSQAIDDGSTITWCTRAPKPKDKLL